jgi:hypothetical protein
LGGLGGLGADGARGGRGGEGGFGGFGGLKGPRGSTIVFQGIVNPFLFSKRQLLRLALREAIFLPRNP